MAKVAGVLGALHLILLVCSFTARGQLIPALEAVETKILDGIVYNASLTVGYGEAIDDAFVKGLACQLEGISPYFTVHLAGVSLEAFPDACGQCISISCANPEECTGSSFDQVVAAVLDDCASENCDGPNALQVNQYLARELTGRSAKSGDAPLEVTWTFVDCSDYGEIFAPPEPPMVELAQPTPEPALEIVSEPTSAPVEAVTPAPVPEPVVEPIPAPAPVEAVTPVPVPEPVVESIPAPVPEPVSIPAPEPESMPAPEPMPILEPVEERISEGTPPQQNTTSETIIPILEVKPDQEDPSPEPAQQSPEEIPAPSLPESAMSDESNGEYVGAEAILGTFKDRIGSLACGFSDSANIPRPTWAAVSFYNSFDTFGSHPCGLCAEVTCSNPSECTGTINSIQVVVVEDCASCSDNNMLLQKSALKALTGSDSQNQVEIKWRPIPCNGISQGKIHMTIYPGNEYYHRVALSNSLEPIVKLTINGLFSTIDKNGQFEFIGKAAPGLDPGPYTIEIVGKSGQVLKTTVQSLFTQDLDVQFS